MEKPQPITRQASYDFYTMKRYFEEVYKLDLDEFLRETFDEYSNGSDKTWELHEILKDGDFSEDIRKMAELLKEFADVDPRGDQDDDGNDFPSYTLTMYVSW